MWLKTVTIKNFRSIENLPITFDRRANVIVGPNAIGKTTLMEAIRLTKATLAPRTQNEMQQTFISLGAVSPHNPMRFNFGALARDVSRSIDIEAAFELTPEEVQNLDSLVPQLETAIVRSGLGPSAIAQGPLALVQYLSSQQGIQALSVARQQINTELPAIKASSRIVLHLTIDPITGTMRGSRQLDQLIFATIEAQIPPHQAIFSYFPADRALPAGEVNIQIGGPDIAAQLETHNSQPQTKFHRLKPTIVDNFLWSDLTRQKLQDNFEKIFSKVLKDRSLDKISVNDFGLISIQIKEASTNRIFDIDGMSSGEKGLILTFLLIGHSVFPGGIIMLDEPELHLNPAVCKTILPFLIEEYLLPNDVQAIICSHSPEILGAAFDSPDCTLLHLQSPTIISKIYSEDKREVFEALRRLGTSASDVLFSAGSIFVEGDHDIELLETGFDEIVARYNITQLGSRGQVENEIRTLKKAEEKGEVDTLKCFIFDLDNTPTTLDSTRLIKVLQWKRRCLENYLIDEKIIYDLLNGLEVSKNRIENRGEVLSKFKDIAISQLQEVVAKSIYEKMEYENPGLRPREIKGKTYPEMAEVLLTRLESIQSQLIELQRENWKKDFVKKCQENENIERPKWESDWLVLCDGKRFFCDLHQRYGVKVSLLKFKKMIVERMKSEQTDAWILTKNLLVNALKVV